MVDTATKAGTLVMAPKAVTFRQHDHLVSVLFGDLFSHSYNIIFSMFLYLVTVVFDGIKINYYYVFVEQLKSTRTKNNLGSWIYLETCS